MPKNFTVMYDKGPYDHLLLFQNYAESTDDGEGSWLILLPQGKGGKGSKSGGGGGLATGGKKAASAAGPAAVPSAAEAVSAILAMSPATRAAVRAALATTDDA
jgi:hypothetical protein